VSAPVPGTKRNSCALCGAVDLRHVLDKDGYPIDRCAVCGLVQLGVELSREELEAIYGEDFFTEAELFHDYVGQRDIRLASGARLSSVLAGIVPGGRLLDVGSAAGFFLEAASKHYEVTGVEFSPFAADYARREFGHRVLTGDVTEAGLEGEQFDVVTMWATIEHMADPLAAVRTVASVTRPGGLFVVSTGDVTGPLARLDLHGWNLMLPPYHLFFFSPATIDVVLRKAGFELRRIIYDGVVAERGPLATNTGRRLATLLGLGNVMTVYATRASEPLPAPSRLHRLDARYRPLRLAFR
jgi:SAM-dependent methyltransferase